MSDRKYLAIDLGASSGRGIVGIYDGEKLTLRENRRFSNDPVKINGRLYWDILRLFHEIKFAIRRTVIDGDNVYSIGIDTWGVDYGRIDKDGHFLSNPVHYRDSRTDTIPGIFEMKMTFDELYAITGIQKMNFNTVYQLFSEKNDTWSDTDKILFIPDLLNYFLTGKKLTEYTVASTGAIIDANSRQISERIINSIGISKNMFGELVQPGNNIGKLLPEVLDETGKTDAIVVNTASHDTASAVISVPSTEKDILYISSGTWSLMGTELDHPVINEESLKYNCTNEGGIDGTVRFLKNIMGLWIIQETRRQWSREGKEYGFAELESAARETPPFKSFIDVDDEMFAKPCNMPSMIKEYCKKTGQYVPETTGEIVRCIYESLAMKYRQVARTIINITGIRPSEINIVGGGSKDGFLDQMTADACGLKVVAGPSEATAIGNIIVQMMSDGTLKDLCTGRELVKRSFEPKIYLPQNTSLWDNAEKVYNSVTSFEYSDK